MCHLYQGILADKEGADVQVGDYNIVNSICIVIIFVISGLTLKTEEMMVAIKYPRPLIYSIVAILGVTPCIGFATIHLPLSPSEFPIGICLCYPPSPPPAGTPNMVLPLVAVP
jgi:sodium/bile acid cotransporter 7